MAIDFPNSPTNGQEYSVGLTTWVYDGAKWNVKSSTAYSNESAPIGTVVNFAGGSGSIPTGWIACDGAAISRSTYATLFSIVGTTYGAGDGSTTFNVPTINSSTGIFIIRWTTTLGTSAPPHSGLHIRGGTDIVDGDRLQVDYVPSGYTRDSAASGAGATTDLAAHLGGIDTALATAQYPHRNLIQNGQMTVCQRATSTSFGTGGGTAYYAADQFHLRNYTWSAGSNITISQDTSVFPTGFRNSLKVATGATGLTFASGGILGISHKVEGYNIAHAYSSTLSLTFWVRSSVTGTYSVSFTNKDVYITTVDRIYVASYTIDAANTWEQKTITVDMAAATASGTWNTTNGIGLHIEWGLGSHTDRRTDAYNADWTNWSGSSVGWQRTTQTQWATNANATFYLTGVQLEVGTVTTPFEIIPFGDELRRCQRYYEHHLFQAIALVGFGQAFNTTVASFYFPLMVEKRALPLMTCTAGNAFRAWNAAGNGASDGALSPYQNNTLSSLSMTFTAVSSIFIAGNVAGIHINVGSAFIAASAEL